MTDNTYIERHILIGLITSTDYLHEIRGIWNPRYLQSPTARRLAGWCIEYYDKYQKAPNQDIEGIYFDKLNSGDLPEDIAEELEEDILPGLSDEYERADKFNLEYLLDQTDKHFTDRHLELHQEKVQAARDAGNTKEAERLANSYQPIKRDLTADVNLSDPAAMKRVEKAFGERMKPLVEYPGALGEFMNAQLTRDALVAFMAPEKRGKSYWLMDIARRGVRQRLNVAFFQAGDMSEAQQIRRLGIHLAKKSDLEHYTGKMWEPVKDCIYNQTDECNLGIRECDHGLVGDDAPLSPKDAREGLTLNQLIALKEHNPDYKACHNCKRYQSQRWGTAWIEQVHVKRPLEQGEAVRIFEDYFVSKNRSLMISTHANDTLSLTKMNNKLDEWYKQGFVPDLIAVDYADLLTVEDRMDFRHKEDQKWKGLRSMSEQRHALVVTATQSDAKSYETGLLKRSNFSEDKRKFAHVTAMYGLNQDPKGREKEIGIMRINELVIREGGNNGVVHVLQNLKRGQPILTSYW